MSSLMSSAAHCYWLSVADVFSTCATFRKKGHI